MNTKSASPPLHISPSVQSIKDIQDVMYYIHSGDIMLIFVLKCPHCLKGISLILQSCPGTLHTCMYISKLWSATFVVAYKSGYSTLLPLSKVFFIHICLNNMSVVIFPM